MTTTTGTVAVLGIGTMGRGMTDSLLRAGIPTVVWDRDPAATAPLAGAGASVAASAQEAASAAEIAITMVPNADAVASVAAAEGMLAALSPGAVWAQMSTIGVAGTDRAAALAASRRPDVAFVDAPVSGSKVPAEEGHLTIFASGPDEARARMAPVFDALGRRTIWVGPAGLGSRLKLVNNTLLAFTAEGVAESVALAHSLGLTTEAVMDAFEGGPLISQWAAAKLQRIARREYSVEFSLDYALKDVRLALDAVDQDKLPVANALANSWQRAVDRGFGHDDVTVVTRALDELPA